MSAGLAVGPPPTTVGPLDTRRLLITLAQVNDDGVIRPKDTCPLSDVDTVLSRVLESRTVLVERRDGSAPLRLRSRAARESEIAWLSRVMAEVLGQITDVELACALVSETVRCATGVRVTIERRASLESGPQPVAQVSQPRPKWRDELPLLPSSRGIWTLVCPPGSRVFATEFPALLSALTRCLGEADVDDVRAQNALRRQLARAVSCGDADAFVEAAAQLLGGAVGLRDSDGFIVAATGSRTGTHPAREIVLRDETGLYGVLEVDAAGNPCPDFGMTDLAVALLRLRSAGHERDALENRLAVLGCFVDREVNNRFAAHARGPRRMVMITPNGRDNVSTVRLGLTRLLRAAAEVPLFADLSLATENDALVGVYSDDGSDARAHRLGWERLLAAVNADGRMVAAVGPSTPGSNDPQTQYQLVSQVSHLQRDGAALFDLPAVAVIDELGPLAGILNAVPGTRTLPYVQRVLGDLITDGRFGGQLIETLYAYLQAGCSPSGAGTLLHLHGSSVKYRMRVLRELLGERLDDPGKRFDLELALRLYLAARELASGVSR